MELVNLNTQIEGFLLGVSTSTQIPFDQSKYVFCLLLSYPLAFLFYSLPNNPTLKHIVGLTIGVWFAWFTMGWQILNSFVSSLVSYIILIVVPTKYSHVVVFVWAMGYLSVSHIYRMYTDYMGWSMDFTGPQMLLTIKLTTFAFDYVDGFKPAEKLTEHQKEMHLKSLPNPLEFFAYVYFFLGFLAGPAFNLKEYLMFIDGTLFDDAKGKPSGRIFATVRKLIATFGILIGVLMQMKFSLLYCRDPEFLTHGFLYKVGYIWVCCSLCRFPYYFAWTLSEGSCVLAGIGYSGTKNGVAKWDRATNCRVIGLETAQNFKAITENWNIRTDHWLKHYIYERVPTANVALTFLTSAVWHGFYPGYYMSFMSSSLVIQEARAIRRNIRPWFLQEDGVTPKPSKTFYDIVCVFASSFTLNYMMAPFMLLGFESSWNVWKSIYFIGHILNGTVFALSLYVIRPPKKKKTT